MSQPKYPFGREEERVRRVLEHGETQSDTEAVPEDEAGHEAITPPRWRYQSDVSTLCGS